MVTTPATQSISNGVSNALGLSTSNVIPEANDLADTFSVDNLRKNVNEALDNNDISSASNLVRQTIDANIESIRLNTESMINKSADVNSDFITHSDIDPSTKALILAHIAQLKHRAISIIEFYAELAKHESSNYRIDADQWKALSMDQAKAKFAILIPEFQRKIRYIIAKLLVHSTDDAENAIHGFEGFIDNAESATPDNSNYQLGGNYYNHNPNQAVPWQSRNAYGAYAPSTTSAYVPSTTAAYVPSTTAAYVPSTTAAYVPSNTAAYGSSTTANYVPSTTATAYPQLQHRFAIHPFARGYYQQLHQQLQQAAPWMGRQIYS